jgi:ribosomal protein S18 acetylase RimI-like enzyme
MSINILQTRFADAPSLRECIDSVSREAGFLASNAAPSQQDLERSLRACLESDSVHLVALDGDRVVAWAQIERGGGTSVAHRGDLGMGVLPPYRGCGLGKRMLTECIDAAHARGIDRVELEVRTDNRRALELYRGSGFAVEAIVKMAMKVGGVYHDAFRMSLMTELAHTGAPLEAGADAGTHFFNHESPK